MIGNLINYSLVTEQLKKKIEKQLKEKVDECEIHYSKNDIYFVVNEKKYAFDSESIKGMIDSQVKLKLPKKSELTFARIIFNKDNNLSAQIFYINEQKEKKFIKYTF